MKLDMTSLLVSLLLVKTTHPLPLPLSRLLLIHHYAQMLGANAKKMAHPQKLGEENIRLCCQKPFCF